MAVEWIVKRIKELGWQDQPFVVVITGGEPFLQPFYTLLVLLQEEFQRSIVVQVETSGSVLNDQFKDSVVQREMLSLIQSLWLHIVVSPKTPRIDQTIRVWAGSWKYIVVTGELSTENGLPAYSTQRPGRRLGNGLALPGHGQPVYLQPCDQGDEKLNYANMLAARDAALKFGYRVSVQVHKILGVS